jgi:23S rRNA pseudouridine2605 synthase
VCSRREAERWIRGGRVRIDGLEMRDPSRSVDPRRDRITVDGRPIGQGPPPLVIALHKPKGYVTTRRDPAGRPTVYELLGDVAQWVFPVGRLDRETSGLLVLTNDHRLGLRLTDPSNRVPKTYHARVAGVPDREALRALSEGVCLRGGEMTRPARVRALGTMGGAAAHTGSTWLELVLTQGRKRQVRRMTAAVGHDVLELVRVGVGRLRLPDLAPGEWRALDGREILRLQSTSACDAGRPDRQRV